ncbi:MAG: hypothetical protein P0Y59_02540 [Candidatus Sphingomonas phytovorans]|nr:hypothetical protein [Sphingomonas sp.]WEK00589.1 MAG: hypothetical protein P0Y59_02540 [Sphingomonas sp.]
MAGLVTAPAVPVDAVAAELRRWASTPFDWTRDNCGLAVLGYAERLRGRQVRPAPSFQGKVGAGLMLERHGGFAGYCSWAMAQIGCAVTETPERGDVALVDLPGSGLTACLCLSRASSGATLWAARGDHAVVIEPGEPTKAWRVTCPRR